MAPQYSCDDEGSTWFFSSCGGILELRRGIQASSCVGPGSLIFHSSCQGDLGIGLHSLKGKLDLIQACIQDLMFLSIGDRDLGLHSILTRGVRPHLEGKQRTPLSSRVATGISWSPLSGLCSVYYFLKKKFIYVCKYVKPLAVGYREWKIMTESLVVSGCEPLVRVISDTVKLQCQKAG